ncbi:hypothetical protein LSTR_LSTR011378 [Laodelphax striatellus]|uniref:Transcription factor TFIIIC triple barrel domain-containing protein n=1 Tax=Laodelphax striatellus TaxID=195883 RepID=A0A482XQK0_LAOST|nr:hypothetical protein LSTR_LSTR011378 [Laodelphax striatellus]
MEETSMEIQNDPVDSAPNNPSQTEDNDEYEEEEILVHVQFDCDVDTKLFNAEEPKIIGLDTENPIMQMGPQFYRGTWQDTMGTSAFFAPEPDPAPIDPIFSRVKTPLMKLACHTRKSLLMSRVFVKPIAGQNSSQVTPENLIHDTNQCANDTNQCPNDTEQCASDTDQCASDANQCVNDTKQCANDTNQCANSTRSYDTNHCANNITDDYVTNQCANDRTDATSVMEVETWDRKSNCRNNIESTMS